MDAAGAAGVQRGNRADRKIPVDGEEYERCTPRGDRARLGQFFTPAPVARLLAALCVRRPDARVFDPACGAGALLIAAAERLENLGGGGQLHGIELDPVPAAIARRALPGAHIAVGDAFDHDPVAFDVVLGNPPFVERRRLADRAHILARLRAAAPERALAADADLSVYFLLHALRFLAPGGRLGFVLPNAWLDHRFGRDLQARLAERCRILVIDAAAERAFAGARVHTVMLVVEAGEGASFVSLGQPLAELVPDAGAAAALARGLEAGEAGPWRRREVPAAQLSAEQRWGATWLRAPALWRPAPDAVPLGRLARCTLGTKTGDDAFFYAPVEVEPAALHPAVRGPGAQRAFGLVPDARLFAPPSPPPPRAAAHLGARPVPALRRGAIAFPKTFARRHAIFANPRGLVLGARFVSVEPEGDPELLLALLNSSYVGLAIEIFGRSSLGRGALDFAVYEVAALPLPRRVEAPEALVAAWRELAREGPSPVEAEVRRPARIALDRLLFGSLGLDPAPWVAALVERVQARERRSPSR